MNQRAPYWLNTRLGIILAAACDVVIIIFAHNAYLYRELHRAAFTSGSIVPLIITWVSISYLLGKYSSARSGRSQKNLLLRQLAATGCVALCVGLTVILGGWVTHANDPRMFGSFFIPFLATVTVSSAICQTIIEGGQGAAESWLLVCAESEKDSIQSIELSRWRSLNNTDIVIAFDKDAMQIDRDRLTGIAISEQAEINDKDLELLLIYRSTGGRVCSLSDWVQEKLHRLPPELLSSRRLTTSSGFRLQPNTNSWRLKRLGDLSISAVLLVLTSPIILLCALAVYLEDRSNPFYRQVRTGIYGSTFIVLKIRSMRTTAEEEGAQWSLRNDTRVTRVGRILRKVRFDELPQLLNVLKGEMSLIGPRPERPELEDILEREISHYRVRHWIRPGLSGWAQVSFPYGASVADSRIKMSYDLYYMKNYSLFLDLVIILKTVRLVASGSGSQPNANDQV